ncbi:hypothetical protein A1A1_17920 [Planococcus antarcticus DSM 14505]|uniref:Uncharacterized protein n=1 Tax=Planococcus antarcticus DSM 14505 TaxID=1185653 RepID=A0A1I9W9M7_9BACL|nr:hypothetical protein BBH88_18830 [Planococcus antarcticus DSM 14505]EIM05093.1 hypothetical protein A1A1_17920 [Planococcus antarcticus DSM 14505]
MADHKQQRCPFDKEGWNSRRVESTARSFGTYIFEIVYLFLAGTRTPINIKTKASYCWECPNNQPLGTQGLAQSVFVGYQKQQ